MASKSMKPNPSVTISAAAIGSMVAVFLSLNQVHDFYVNWHDARFATIEDTAKISTNQRLQYLDLKLVILDGDKWSLEQAETLRPLTEAEGRRLQQIDQAMAANRKKREIMLGIKQDDFDI